MEKIYVKKLKQFVDNNEQNRQLLTDLGYINDVKNTEKPAKQSRVNIVRTGNRKPTE